MTPAELFDANTRLAHWTMHRMGESIKGQDPAEVEQDALAGLWHSCQRFDESLGWKFSTYAVGCIRGFIFNGIRDRRGKNPAANDVLSLESVGIRNVNDEYFERTLGGRLTDPADDIEDKVVNKNLLDEVFEAVGGRDTIEGRALQTLMSPKFGGPSLREVADEFGVSPETVRNRRIKAMQRVAHLANVA